MIKPNGVMTDESIEALRNRNEARAAQVVKEMGARHACHSANAVRKDPSRANFTPRDEVKNPLVSLLTTCGVR